MLKLEAVTLTQGDFTLSADFEIPKGARVAILGPSGAGKSSLLSVIGGYTSSSSGDCLWGTQSLRALSPAERPIASVFQDNNLFAHMSASQNVSLGIRPSLRLTEQERDRVAEALAMVDLAEFGRRRPYELSGGQQSRVALARVLVQEKPLVLLDEPFSALGPAMRRDMIALTRDIAKRLGATILMVSHDIEDVKKFADLVVWVENGVCASPQPMEAFLAAPPDAYKNYAGR